MLKAAITQPNFLPWIGYFDLLSEVDLFIALDNVQFVNRSFIVRNKIKAPNGEAKWVTVNLDKPSREDNINEVQLQKSDWVQKHIERIKNYYRKAPFFDLYFPLIESELLPQEQDKVLSNYNIRLIKFFAKLLSIKTNIVEASSIFEKLDGEAEEKILKLCNHFEVTDYYNFQKGIDVGLYNPSNFKAHGINLFRHNYQHPYYSQINGDFLSYLSILDLLFNEGKESFRILKSGSNWDQLN